MNKVIIVLVCVLVVLGVVVVVLRPGDGQAKNPTQPGPLISQIGGLLPAVPVEAADLAGRPCWDSQGTLTSRAGQTCRSTLPERATRLTICAGDGAFVRVRVQGAQYPAQDADLSNLSCATGGFRFSLYDQQSVLTVTCSPVGPCRLQLL